MEEPILEPGWLQEVIKDNDVRVKAYALARFGTQYQIKQAIKAAEKAGFNTKEMVDKWA